MHSEGSELFAKLPRVRLQRKWCRVGDSVPPQLCLIITPGCPTRGECPPQNSVGWGSQISRLHCPPTKQGQLTPGFSTITKKDSHICRNSCGFTAKSEGLCGTTEYRTQYGNLSQCRTHIPTWVIQNWYGKFIRWRSVRTWPVWSVSLVREISELAVRAYAKAISISKQRY